LVDRTDRLTAEVGELRAQLGALLMGQTVESIEPAEEVETAPETVPESEPVELFSRQAAVANTPIVPLETVVEQVETEQLFRQGVQEKAAPYIAGFNMEFISRLADTKYESKNLPKMPDFTTAPEAWRKYVKKYGERLKWTEEHKGEHKDEKHDFSLTYLPHSEPVLVGFDSDTTALVDKGGWKDAYYREVHMDIDQGMLRGLAHKTSRNGGNSKIRSWNLDQKVNFELELAASMTLAYGNKEHFDNSEYTLEYPYDLQKGAFVQTYNKRYQITRDMCSKGIDKALADVPRMPVQSE
jgi:hypothetical protein